MSRKMCCPSVPSALVVRISMGCPHLAEPLHVSRSEMSPTGDSTERAVCQAEPRNDATGKSKILPSSSSNVMSSKLTRSGVTDHKHRLVIFSMHQTHTRWSLMHPTDPTFHLITFPAITTTYISTSTNRT